MHILSEYESWGLCGVVKEVMGVWQYDDTDLDRLCTIMTLHDLGFSIAETLLVASDYKIPTCSYGLSEPQVRFTVESDRSTSKYTRVLRLDCIVLKPHEDENNDSNE